MLTSGELKPMKRPLADNPPAIVPAGGVHCDFQSWLRFLRVYLNPKTESPIAKPDTLKALLAASEGKLWRGLASGLLRMG